jgi:hypothetical protein
LHHSKSRLAALALAAIALLAVLVPAATAQPAQPSIKLYLRRGTFDPLVGRPSVAAAVPADASSRLVLAQFTTPPTDALRQALAAAGVHPLLYIPDNGLVLRLSDAGHVALRKLPSLRWYGVFEPAYKLAADLDSQLKAPANPMLDLRLLVAADANLAGFGRGLLALGGQVLGQSAGVNGVALRVRVPAGALGQIMRRDDVLWAEPFRAPRALNDQARDILGVTSARQQLSWLDGSGQIVAVADTGLDVQSSVQGNANPDFPASRIAAAFSPWEVGSSDPQCPHTSASAIWSDRNGHGTHVSGTVLGAGARSPSGLSFAGMAPGAKLVVQSMSTGGDVFDCFPTDVQALLAQAYGAGARVHNASWGDDTTLGDYTQFASDVDSFLWQHKDYLLVFAAGNRGADASPRDGVIDPDSISQPATAKDIVTVGASENNRPPTTLNTCLSGLPRNMCWSSYVASAPPISGDFISDNPNGMAAFSSRGPTTDGRIKPEIVAPGTNIVSAASQDPSAFYSYPYPGSSFYAYDNGTSMAAPMISGMAALVRQWLAKTRQVAAPSAALVKALLLNGAANMSPGQYGTGSTREIPAAWPNSVEGWGRAALPDTIGLNGSQVWLADSSAGLATPGAAINYSLLVGAGQPLRLTLAWTDYPGNPQSSKALVNDLDLEVQTPDGALVRGNATAALGGGCRDSQTGADRCDNAESVVIAAPAAGLYTVRVRAAKLPVGLAQPFALVGSAQSIADHALDAPVLQLSTSTGSPALALNWNAIAEATFYTIEQSPTSDFTALSSSYTITQTSTTLVVEAGTAWYRVRACTLGGCGAPSNAMSATVLLPPQKRFLPSVDY